MERVVESIKNILAFKFQNVSSFVWFGDNMSRFREKLLP